MESHYITSMLHLVDGCIDIEEDDYVKIKLNDGSIFNGQVSEVNTKTIVLTFNDYLDGEITIPYKEIDTIELIQTT